jgi:hypothetical protein
MRSPAQRLTINVIRVQSKGNAPNPDIQTHNLKEKTMNVPNPDSLMIDLTAEETAALNGGGYCSYAYVLRRVCSWFRCYYQYVYVWRCV